MYISNKLLGNIFVVISVIYVLVNMDVLVYMFSDVRSWDMSLVYFVAPMLTLIFGTFLFKRGEKLGWFLLAAFSSYAGVNMITLFLLYIGVIESNKFDLFMLTPDIVPTAILAFGVVFVALSAMLYTSGIRKENGVGRDQAITTALLSLGVFILLLFTYP